MVTVMMVDDYVVMVRIMIVMSCLHKDESDYRTVKMIMTW